MNIASLILLLQLSAALLTSVAQNSALPQSFQKQALDLSRQAVELVSRSLAQNVTAGISADDLLDTAWKKTFHWMTFFDTLAGFTAEGNARADGTQFVLTTEPREGNRVYILKQPVWQGLITFSQKSYFRTAFIADSLNLKAYFVVGKALNARGDQYYGFKIENNSLYGVSSRDGTSNEASVLLRSELNGKYHQIEARYYPGEKVQLYVDPSKSDQGPKGTLISQLPNNDALANIHLMNIVLETSDNAAKHLQTSYFEYIQRRDVLD